jgi:hypothetical protein
MPFWKDDVAVLLGPELGVRVTFGLNTVYGHFDRATGNIVDAEIGAYVAMVPSVLLKHDAFPTMPVKGDTLTVDGSDATVRDVSPIDDGSMRRFTLAFATT